MPDRSAEESALDAQLQALARATHPDLRIGCRAIRPGDEDALSDTEAQTIPGVASVRRASGAARIVARALLAELGIAAGPLSRTATGTPAWPAGCIGSLAHDDRFAVAVVARFGRLASVGIDVEPSTPLADELHATIATEAERRLWPNDGVALHLLFCIKEAVFKATHPIDGLFLDHHDVSVDPHTLLARTRGGRVLRARASDSPRLVALTVIGR